MACTNVYLKLDLCSVRPTKLGWMHIMIMIMIPPSIKLFIWKQKYIRYLTNELCQWHDPHQTQPKLVFLPIWEFQWKSTDKNCCVLLIFKKQPQIFWIKKSKSLLFVIVTYKWLLFTILPPKLLSEEIKSHFEILTSSYGTTL